MRLVKQKDIAEERKCLFKQSENILEEILDDLENDNDQHSGMDSPNFLIPPGKFDSTPRSRSQSVELPEFTMVTLPMNLSEHQKSNRKMSLSSSNSVTTGPPDVHVMVQPPSPVFVHPKVV